MSINFRSVPLVAKGQSLLTGSRACFASSPSWGFDLLVVNFFTVGHFKKLLLFTVFGSSPDPPHSVRVI